MAHHANAKRAAFGPGCVEAATIANAARCWLHVNKTTHLPQNAYPLAAGSGREKLMSETLLSFRGLSDICLELADLPKRLCDLLK